MSEKRNAALGFIFITILIDVIGFGIIIPVLPKLIAELIGGTISQAAQYGGFLIFSFAIAQFFFSPILGNLSDQYGRRPILLLALLGTGLDYVFLAFAPTIAWLFVGRIIAGATGASFSTASAYIADISTPEKRAQNFGMIGAAFGLGFIIGPVIGGILGQYGSRLPFIAAAVLSLINAAYGFFILPESLSADHRRKFTWGRANPVGSVVQLKKYPVVGGLIISMLFIYIAAHALQSTWTYITMEKFKWSEAMVGYSLGVVGLLVGLVQGGLVRIVIPKIGQVNAVYLGLSLYVAGFILFAFASTTLMMFIFLVPYCLGGLCGPAIQGLISTQVPSNEQGELQGSLTGMQSVTSIIGPLLMTNLFTYFTSGNAPVYLPGVPFIAGAVLTVFSLIFAYRTLSKGFFGQNPPVPDTSFANTSDTIDLQKSSESA